MKKPLLIWVSALVLLASATFLFAQTTTGSSLITEMKASLRDFTLAGQLNPGISDLKSAPVWGKKTGDMLTAAEYNRILELVGQGGGGGSGGAGKSGSLCGWVVDSSITGAGAGDTALVMCDGHNPRISCPSGYTKRDIMDIGAVAVTYYSRISTCVSDGGGSGGGGGTGGGTGGGGSGWVDVPLTDTNPFDQQCMYRFVTQGQTYYAETVHEDKLYWINSQHFTKTNKSVLVFGTAPYNTATKMEKFCGGGGGGGGFNWDACTPEWVGTPKNGTPYTNAAGLKCKYTGTGPGAPGTNYYYLCCPGA